MGTRGSRASSLRERRRLAAKLAPSVDPLALQGILVWRGTQQRLHAPSAFEIFIEPINCNSAPYRLTSVELIKLTYY